MKHENYFNEFLKNEVNLNQSRLDTLQGRVKTITDLLKEKLEGYRKYSEQGSYAHKTIIKPVRENDEFDADVLVYIKDDEFNKQNFVDHVKKVHDIFMNDGNYKDKTHLNPRCVTINYAGDFHLDIVPCIEHNGSFYICNRRDKQYEETDGEGYKEWLTKKNNIIGGNYFRKTTRLLKFLRDHKNNFSIKSILLTTILGNHVYDGANCDDLPTTLVTLSGRVNVFLQGHPNMPIITNPVLPSEDFNRNWDQIQYNNFRDKFDSYNQKIKEAYQEKEHNESVKKWRKLFGDSFGKLQESQANTAVNTAAKVTTGAAAGILGAGVAATKPYGDYD